MTDIRAAQCLVCRREELPLRWAIDLGQLLEPRLRPERLEQLHERVVSLDAGVMLAHMRSPLVREPTLGAYKASNPPSDQEPWLWVVVLIPQADASRHLGWMAHLAAGLHDKATRSKVYEAEDGPSLVTALRAMLAVQTHRFLRPVSLKVPEPVAAPAPVVAVPAAEHRLIVAILKEESYVDDLLALFVEHDVRGATILEARGMAEHLAAHMSLFAGFRSAFKAVGHSQVVLAVVPAARTEEVLEIVRLAAGGMTTPGAGIAFALDVPYTIGLRKAEV
jgi:hypothetical protein